MTDPPVLSRRTVGDGVSEGRARTNAPDDSETDTRYATRRRVGRSVREFRYRWRNFAAQAGGKTRVVKIE